MITPFNIGPLRIDYPVILAPMAGYTDAAMRSIAIEQGAGLTYTEVVNTEALVRDSRLTYHMLGTWPNEHPVAAHIYGCNPEVMAESARRIEELGRFDMIDLNCGCPVRKIVAKGSGAALIKKPKLIAEIVTAIRSATSLPVTVKTRIGYSNNLINISEIASAVESAGASALAIHGRLVCNHHQGPSDWDLIASIKQQCSIPVIGNGGVECAEDVVRMFDYTGVDGVMIGRAAVGNPWIFSEAKNLLSGQSYVRHDLAEQRRLMLEHLDRSMGVKAEEQKIRRRSPLSAEQAACLHFRSFLFQYFKGFKDWSDVRKSLNTMTSRRAVIDAIDTVLSRQK